MVDTGPRVQQGFSTGSPRPSPGTAGHESGVARASPGKLYSQWQGVMITVQGIILTMAGSYDFLTGSYGCITTNTDRFDVGMVTIVHQMDEGRLQGGENPVTEDSG